MLECILKNSIDVKYCTKCTSNLIFNMNEKHLINTPNIDMENICRYFELPENVSFYFNHNRLLTAGKCDGKYL